MARATRLPPTRSDDGTTRRSPPGSAASTARGSPPCGPAMGADHGSAMGLMRSTCLWFGKDAEAAVRFYVSLVPDSCLEHIQRAPSAWPGGEAGDVILVTFTLAGQSFQALNDGTPADYGTAASISVRCADQAEVDRLWAALTADGGSEIMCGWLRDR